eukprot:767964-Hanusia_phi.AAC.5
MFQGQGESPSCSPAMLLWRTTVNGCLVSSGGDTQWLTLTIYPQHFAESEGSHRVCCTDHGQTRRCLMRPVEMLEELQAELLPSSLMKSFYLYYTENLSRCSRPVQESTASSPPSSPSSPASSSPGGVEEPEHEWVQLLPPLLELRKDAHGEFLSSCDRRSPHELVEDSHGNFLPPQRLLAQVPHFRCPPPVPHSRPRPDQAAEYNSVGRHGVLLHQLEDPHRLLGPATGLGSMQEAGVDELVGLEVPGPDLLQHEQS